MQNTTPAQRPPAVKPYQKNPRKISKDHKKRLLESSEYFGQAELLAIGPAGEVYNGHQRLSVWLEAYGPEYKVEARQSDRPLSETEKRKLTIFLHSATAGQWDWEQLQEWDMEEFKDWGFDSALIKDWQKDAEKLKALLASQDKTVDAEPQVDRAEELNKLWKVETGDLWQLGNHRLLCGDCTVRENMERLMGGEVAKLAPVDPPYNVGFDYDGETVDDDKTEKAYEDFSRAWFAECQRVSEKQIVTAGCYNLPSWLRWFDSYHVGTWIKSNSMTNGRVSRFWCWEPVIFFGEKFGKKRASDIFDYPIGQQKDVANHPCPKPLKMWEDLIDNYSEKGDLIYEAFCGSGTTIIAAENLGRRCYAMEISPNYCAVILQRMSDAFPALEIKKIDAMNTPVKNSTKSVKTRKSVR